MSTQISTTAIEQAISGELAPFSTIEKREIEALKKEAQVDPIGMGLSFLRVENGRARLLNQPRGTYWLHFAELLARACKSIHLDEVEFVVSEREEGRVLLQDSPPTPISLPNGEQYAHLLRQHGGRLDALDHPTVFSPTPWKLVHRPVPIFSIAKVRGLHADLLYPGQHASMPNVHNNVDSIPWEDKLPVLYWTGASTGGTLTKSLWTRFPRMRLAMLAKEWPDAKVAITRVTQTKKEDVESISEAMRQAGILGEEEPVGEGFKYKYAFDIEGNYSAFRLPRLLQSNCLVIKPKAIYEEFFYRWLQPGKHFIEVAANLADLRTQLDQAKTDDEQAQGIAEESTAFAKTCFCWETAVAYMTPLLKTYAELYR